MKVILSDKTDRETTKLGTIVGELYQLKGSSSVLFRCQGGFVNMASGEFSDYENCTASVTFVHLPEARLHLND